jgi:hypothetical protein
MNLIGKIRGGDMAAPNIRQHLGTSRIGTERCGARYHGRQYDAHESPGPPQSVLRLPRGAGLRRALGQVAGPGVRYDSVPLAPPQLSTSNPAHTSHLR